MSEFISSFIIVIAFIIFGFAIGYFYFDSDMNISLSMIVFMIIVASLFDVIEQSVSTIAIMIFIILLYINIKKSSENV